jgi:hypothetical protein
MFGHSYNTKTMEVYQMDIKRITNDKYGNPRYVVHFLALGLDDYINITPITGFKKYKGKDFGGGYVFTSYNVKEDINKAKQRLLDNKLIKRIATKANQELLDELDDLGFKWNSGYGLKENSIVSNMNGDDVNECYFEAIPGFPDGYRIIYFDEQALEGLQNRYDIITNEQFVEFLKECKI